MVEDQAQFVSLQIVEFLVANKLVELFGVGLWKSFIDLHPGQA